MLAYNSSTKISRKLQLSSFYFPPPSKNSSFPAGFPILLAPSFLRLRFSFHLPLCAFINCIYLLTYLLTWNDDIIHVICNGWTSLKVKWLRLQAYIMVTQKRAITSERKAVRIWKLAEVLSRSNAINSLHSQAYESKVKVTWSTYVCPSSTCTIVAYKSVSLVVMLMLCRSDAVWRTFPISTQQRRSHRYCYYYGPVYLPQHCRCPHWISRATKCQRGLSLNLVIVNGKNSPVCKWV